jgi:hypothetical protein
MSPVVVVNIFGCAESVVLLILSFVYGDGMSQFAAILLSTLSTLVGMANRWLLRLPDPYFADTPPTDNVIYWPDGSFLVVKRNGDVAQELFWAPEDIPYTLYRRMRIS